MSQIVDGWIFILDDLKRKERRELLIRLTRENHLTEEEQDILLIESRRKDWFLPRRRVPESSPCKSG